MSDTTIGIMLLIGFGVPLLAGSTALYFLWQARNRVTLVFLFILHVICGFASPILGVVSWIPMFFTPFADGYKPKENSFNDVFLDKDES